MGRTDGKVAIITGGARDQGSLEAELLNKEGGKVIIYNILDQGAILNPLNIRCCQRLNHG